MFKNYDKIKDWLYIFQDGVCPCCGEKLSGIIDICHNLARTKKNRENYKLFIDSRLNTFLGHRACNVARKQPVKDNPDKFIFVVHQYYENNGKHIKINDGLHIDNLFQSFYCQGFTYAVAAQMERFLQDNPEFSKFVNCEV